MTTLVAERVNALAREAARLRLALEAIAATTAYAKPGEPESVVHLIARKALEHQP